MSTRTWFQQPQWKSRLVAESLLMSERFPGFRLVQSAGGQLKWLGILKPTGSEEYLVSVTYPPDYPYREPSLRVENPAVVAGAPHLYLDGSLCLHKRTWNANRATAVGEVPLIAGWLLAYEHWLLTGERF